LKDLSDSVNSAENIFVLRTDINESTWASYALYVVGRGLGLAGRLFSVEGPAPGE
jgi:hypothetical protein